MEENKSLDLLSKAANDEDSPGLRLIAAASPPPPQAARTNSGKQDRLLKNADAAHTNKNM